MCTICVCRLVCSVDAGHCLTLLVPTCHPQIFLPPCIFFRNSQDPAPPLPAYPWQTENPGRWQASPRSHWVDSRLNECNRNTLPEWNAPIILGRHYTLYLTFIPVPSHFRIIHPKSESFKQGRTPSWPLHSRKLHWGLPASTAPSSVVWGPVPSPSTSCPLNYCLTSYFHSEML